MRGTVRNKERWKGRRAPTQDPSTNHLLSRTGAGEDVATQPEPTVPAEQAAGQQEEAGGAFSARKAAADSAEARPSLSFLY